MLPTRLLRPHTTSSCLYASRRFARALGVLIPWTDEARDSLLAFIDNNYRGKVKGDWDKVCTRIRATASRSGISWTDEERQRLKRLVEERFLDKGLRIGWEEIGKAFSRPASTCTNVYYGLPRETRRMHHDELNQPTARVVQLSKLARSHGGLVDEAIRRLSSSDGTPWERVADEVGLPLQDTLEIAVQCRDPKAEPLRSLQYPNDWPKELADRLQQFIRQHCSDQVRVSWGAVGMYLGVEGSLCAEAHMLMTQTFVPLKRWQKYWTVAERERLQYATDNRQKYPTWADVARYVGTRAALCCASQHSQLKLRKRATRWTREERGRIEAALLGQRAASRTRHAPLIATLFPDKPYDEVQYQLVLAASRINTRQATAALRGKENEQRLLDAVKRHTTEGQIDWNMVVKDVGVPKTTCRHAYGRLTRVPGSQFWKREEVDALNEGLRTVPPSQQRWQIISQMVGTRSPQQCLQKTIHLDRLHRAAPPKIALPPVEHTAPAKE
ncbi:hypothetical protein GGF46_004837 [Coemansia sp. RSA 552]|nr:hypothetical protein GGF46_004837 [Coemansia sp. RSA 552]